MNVICIGLFCVSCLVFDTGVISEEFSELLTRCVEKPTLTGDSPTKGH